MSNKERSMLRDSADLGTPSAPPIFDVPSDGRSNEAEDHHQGLPEVFTENDQSDNGTCPSRESVGFDAVKEGLGNWKLHSSQTAEFGERYLLGMELLLPFWCVHVKFSCLLVLCN